MASEGPNDPGTGAQSGGDTEWTNPNTIINDGGGSAICALAAIGASNLLYGEDFSFAIPAGSTIDGILAEWNRKKASGSGVVEDVSIYIRKGGSEGSENKSAAGAWPGSLARASYGGAADLWSETWSVSDINASNFGGHLYCVETGGADSVVAHVDHLRITVTYTAPPLDYVEAITMQTSQPVNVGPPRAVPYFRRRFSQTRGGILVPCPS